MEVVNQILTGLLALVPRDPEVIIALLGTGGAVAVVLQVVKYFGKLQEAKKTITVLLGVLSFFADQVMTAIQFLPASFSNELGWVIASAVFMHRFVVSPAGRKLVALLEKFQRVFTDAKAYRAEMDGMYNAPEAPAAPATAPHEFSLGL